MADDGAQARAPLPVMTRPFPRGYVPGGESRARAAYSFAGVSGPAASAAFLRPMRFWRSRNSASAPMAPRKIVLGAPPPPPPPPPLLLLPDEPAEVVVFPEVDVEVEVDVDVPVLGALAEKIPRLDRPPKRLLKAGST